MLMFGSFEGVFNTNLLKFNKRENYAEHVLRCECFFLYVKKQEAASAISVVIEMELHETDTIFCLLYFMK